MVLGGGGYIGTELVCRLDKLGLSTTVVDLFWFGHHLPNHIECLKQDISTLTPQQMEGFDAVVFLGGLSNDPMAEYSPRLNFIENVATPIGAAFTARKAGVRRFVFASSTSIYGFTDNKILDEQSPVGPEHPYGISKLAAETAILRLATRDFLPIALRKGTVGGYSPRMRFDLVVNAMTKSALSSGKIVVNNPEIWRPLIDIRDVALAYTLAVQAPVVGVFNILENNYTLAALADIVRRVIQNTFDTPIEIETKYIFDVRNYIASGRKAREGLEFKPTITPEETVKSIIDRFNPSSDFSNPQYYNILTFKTLF